MKTLLVIANEWTTIVHFRMEILDSLLKANYRVVVALPVCQEAEPIREIGCELVNLDIARHGKNPLKDLALLKQCRNLIKKYRPGAVITYTVKPNIYGSYACRLTGTPYINNVTGIGTILQSKSALSSLMLKMMKLAFRKSSCVFFQNKDNYERFLKEGVVTEKTHMELLPGSGVNLEKFNYAPMNENSDTIRFIIVSRIRHDKGYSEFFDAAEQIKAKYPKTEFHVAGWYEDDDLHERIDDLVKKGIIIYHGSISQEEVHQRIAESTCLIHPSYHEGMANVILEAAATGRAVLASNICGCKEAVEDGKTGYLFEAKSTSSLVEAIERFLKLSREEKIQFGKAGREKMEKEFDRKLVAGKLIEQIEIIV